MVNKIVYNKRAENRTMQNLDLTTIFSAFDIFFFLFNTLYL